MLPSIREDRISLSRTDFNDIFRDLERNMKRILSHYKIGSVKFNCYALHLMDQMRLCVNDKRKSAMLMSSFEDLLINQDGHPTQILTKKTVDDHAGIDNRLELLNIQSEGAHSGMSFGGHPQKQIQQNYYQLKQDDIDDDFTFSPMHKSVMKHPDHEIDLGKKQGAQSHPVHHSKSHGRQSQWAVKQLDNKIIEANMNVEPSPENYAQNVPFQEMVKSIRKIGHDVERQAEEDDDVQYNLTDYSSNESSNDAVYKYQYRDEWEENQDMNFQDSNVNHSENLFSGNVQPSSQTQFAVFDFKKFENLKKTDSNVTALMQPALKPNSLMKSPFKPLTQRKKRLYCRNKRIPFWAEDLSKVTHFNKGKDPDQIFGRCVVENLNAEYLFPNQTMDYTRTSSAKWNHNAVLY